MQVIHWDGTHVPDELAEVAPGWYFLAPMNGEIWESEELSEEEDAAVQEGLRAAEAGDVFPWTRLCGTFRPVFPVRDDSR